MGGRQTRRIRTAGHSRRRWGEGAVGCDVAPCRALAAARTSHVRLCVDGQCRTLTKADGVDSYKRLATPPDMIGTHPCMLGTPPYMLGTPPMRACPLPRCTGVCAGLDVPGDGGFPLPTAQLDLHGPRARLRGRQSQQHGHRPWQRADWRTSPSPHARPLARPPALQLRVAPHAARCGSYETVALTRLCPPHARPPIPTIRHRAIEAHCVERVTSQRQVGRLLAYRPVLLRPGHPHGIVPAGKHSRR